MKVLVTQTDTFGGCANYSWVNRWEFTMKDNASRLAIVRKVKDETGYANWRCKVEDWGDTLVIDPSRECTRIFVEFENE